MSKRDTHKPKRKRYFFLNPYDQYAFTKCPKCEGKTLIRKFALAIHIEPIQLFVLNKQCRYCPRCELIIARKSEVESLMTAAFEQRRPEIVGNKYLVFGVLGREDWRESLRREMTDKEAVERVVVFKDVWNFEVIPGGWYPDPDARPKHGHRKSGPPPVPTTR